MTRDDEIKGLSDSFRKQYIDGTPSWYHGMCHLIFNLGFTGGIALLAISKLSNVTAWEWLIVVPIFLFGNYIEWAGHRYLLHRPTGLLKIAYKRHVGVHHVFFTHRTLQYRGHKAWRALLFPPLAPILFTLSAVPPALVLGAVWSANAGWIAMMTMGLYYLMYEGLHTLSHIPNSRFLDRLPLVNTVLVRIACKVRPNGESTSRARRR